MGQFDSELIQQRQSTILNRFLKCFKLSQGAGIGMASSFILMMWLGIASQLAKSNGFIHNQMKSFSTESCPVLSFGNLTSNVTTTTIAPPAEPEEIFVLLRVSYLWYTLMGFLIVLILGTLASLMTGPQARDQLDPKLVWPFLRRHVGSNNKKEDENKKTGQGSAGVQLEMISR